jgi:hypothetical protein
MKKISFILLIGIVFNASGQDVAKTTYRPLGTIEKNTGGSEDDGLFMQGFEHKKAIAVYAGSAGFGADFRYGFLPRLSVRLGAGTTPVNIPNAFKINSFSSDIDLNVNFTNVHLIADFQPFGGSGFRVAFGMGYFIKGSTSVDVVPTSGSKYGNVSITALQLGYININANWKGAAPYLGVGFARTFPGVLFNINVDLGTYYLSAPQTTIIAMGALAGNEANNEQLQENLSNYRWLPVLQLNFNFRL